MIGGDADPEKTRRILHRVIKWGRDGITIEAGQRHVREMLKDLELEQANHEATPCNVEKHSENIAGSNGSMGETQCEQGQRQTKHDWDDAGDGDDKNRVQMTNDERDECDDTNDSQTLTGGDITKWHSWRASVTCRNTDQITSLRQCKNAVRWQSRTVSV